MCLPVDDKLSFSLHISDYCHMKFDKVNITLITTDICVSKIKDIQQTSDSSSKTKKNMLF